jgi:hypothetical protein
MHEAVLLGLKADVLSVLAEHMTVGQVSALHTTASTAPPWWWWYSSSSKQQAGTRNCWQQTRKGA